MKSLIRIVFAAAIMVLGAVGAMAIEEVMYQVVIKDGSFEVRDYAPYILAETVVEGDFAEAGNRAFNLLFGYISGENRSRRKVAMTTPVSQESAGEKIEMTAPVSQEPVGEKIEMTAPVSQESVGEKIEMTSPVGQERVQGKWVVSFMMPASYTMETLPEPEDPQVTLRQVPARRMAAVRYSGFWSEKNYLRYKLELESWIQKKSLTIIGEPVWARYNSPFMPWFLRRNEVLIPVDAGTE